MTNLNNKGLFFALLALLILPKLRIAIELQRVEAIDVAKGHEQKSSRGEETATAGQQVQKQTMTLSPKIDLIPQTPDRIVVLNNLEFELDEDSDSDDSEQEAEVEVEENHHGHHESRANRHYVAQHHGHVNAREHQAEAKSQTTTVVVGNEAAA